ncbi:hypothetical protein SAMN04487911_12428 [Arenibacter nanhaiticus]|uniref:YbbR-like protein n=1 Tax=Arenibacter nanhaiticus TaxID=558155 RepID=A0A1M6K2Z5_9FLAO|nr:hypothetical protein SAMN04487911_12428 [Arenibacter nanhaiticus]
MINNIKKRLDKRKVKLSLIFLTCSFLAWFVTNLTENYTENAEFDLQYSRPPDSLLFNGASKKNIKVRLRTSGFQFLLFGFRNKQVHLSLSSLKQKGTKYYIPPSVYKNQIENQLPKSISILDMDRDTLFFDFRKLYKREIPITANVKLNLEPHYLIDGTLRLEPSKLTVIGPKHEIDSLQFIETESLVVPQLKMDFNKKLALRLPKNLKHTRYSHKETTVSVQVFKFSEKLIEVPVQVINVPEGTLVRTFPDRVSVICKARLEDLKNISVTNFLVVVDYAEIKEGRDNILQLKLLKKPDHLNVVELKENEVEFILKRE